MMQRAMRTSPRALTAALFSLGLLLCGGPLPAGEEATPDLDGEVVEPSKPQVFVAQVDTGRIPLEDVLEVWRPAWRDIIHRCRTGALDEQEADRELQAAWETAVETAVREEIFYREAVRSIHEQIKQRAREIHSQRAPGSMRNPEQSASYRSVYRELREHVTAQIEEYIQLLIQRNIRRLGGETQLHEVLARQGLTWEEWRERLQRKAYISFYHNRITPDSRLAIPSPSEIRAYYRQHPDEFRQPGVTRFRHLLLRFREHSGEEKTRRLAADIYDRLLAEELDFAQAARQYSDDAVSAEYGGIEPLPETVRGSAAARDRDRLAWMADVRDAVEDLPAGELGPVLLSPVGCHLVYVIERVPGEVLPFAEAQKEIAQLLRSRRREAEIQAAYEELRGNVTVEIDMPLYPEEYSWPAVRARMQSARGAAEE
jgi:hypothetical protein